jgi:hypothetical protein
MRMQELREEEALELKRLKKASTKKQDVKLIEELED